MPTGQDDDLFPLILGHSRRDAARQEIFLRGFRVELTERDGGYGHWPVMLGESRRDGVSLSLRRRATGQDEEGGGQRVHPLSERVEQG